VLLVAFALASRRFSLGWAVAGVTVARRQPQ